MPLMWNLLAFALVPWPLPFVQGVSAGLDDVRPYYLHDLFLPLDYQPGKNSFILQRVRRGDRKDLLRLEGSGSVRHIWSTWCRSFQLNTGTEPGKIYLRFYVDGENSPGLEGNLDELFIAAERTGARFMPQPAFNYEGGYNLYLPVYFRAGIRIEMEALDDLDEFYIQLDYRRTTTPGTSARLVGIREKSGLRLAYRGKGAPEFERDFHDSKTNLIHTDFTFQLIPGEGSAPLEIAGPGIVRQLSFSGEALEQVHLQIFWDGQKTPAVQAPLKYFFGQFRTVGLDSRSGTADCYFPMPFRQKARIVLSLLQGPSPNATVDVRLSWEQVRQIPSKALYFCARFSEENPTRGFQDLSILRTEGSGHFVGLNLFDSGHNHGGGDVALIDAAGAVPLVLHGICAEDYFSFAWHKTGRMHDYAGAPEHERRYRFHFENPYPFKHSLQVNFGIFGDQHPRSVAFWYQNLDPENGEDQDSWIAPDAAWKVLGPLAVTQSFPAGIEAQGLDTKVLLSKEEPISITWQPASMSAGFLDLCHHYRHFITRASGTGYIAGDGQYRAVANLYVPAARTLKWRIGHDDALVLRINDQSPQSLSESAGFQASIISASLNAGWNRIEITFQNDENVNWRWPGISLAINVSRSEFAEMRWGK
ncbi:MAG TPA: DUF2961 domain-containing protein [Acidobacteriota bacterium]|nr:DUF2961 domain-containing protein [Acidobacteriota bacterium]